MLARTVEIDDLHHTGEVLFSEVPDPFGSVTHDDFLLGAALALARRQHHVSALARISQSTIYEESIIRLGVEHGVCDCSGASKITGGN